MQSRADQIVRENRRLRDFQSRADDVSRLIVDTDLPWVDIAIRIEELRVEAAHQFPLREHVFEWVYVRRFRRLWEQWRLEE